MSRLKRSNTDKQSNANREKPQRWCILHGARLKKRTARLCFILKKSLKFNEGKRK